MSDLSFDELPRPSVSYSVEHAKSGRSTCKKCQSKIEKGAIRIGTVRPGPDGCYSMCSWCHLECQPPPKKLHSLDELEGIGSMSESDLALLTNWFDPKTSSPKRSRDDNINISSLHPKRMKVKELREALTSLGVLAEGKKKDLVQILDEVVERAAAHALYQTLTVPALKDLLRENRQLLSGNKTELLERCVDGKLYGALPRCPECGGGRLRVHYPSQYGHGGQGEFHCPGFYDDDHYQRCSYTSHHVTRDPWREGESLEGPSPDAV